YGGGSACTVHLRWGSPPYVVERLGFLWPGRSSTASPCMMTRLTPIPRQGKKTRGPDSLGEVKNVFTGEQQVQGPRGSDRLRLPRLLRRAGRTLPAECVKSNRTRTS